MLSPTFLIVATLLSCTFVTNVSSQDSSDDSSQGEQPVICLHIPKATMDGIQCGMSAMQVVKNNF
ncbi:unnamed protein product [Larinioides sclopetarius]|uniref:Uncharacterized protein n=1 Tax=Larinioides sclopetarius TaxID=280406 RepID=A0AAV2AJD4_9ARAC